MPDPQISLSQTRPRREAETERLSLNIFASFFARGVIWYLPDFSFTHPRFTSSCDHERRLHEALPTLNFSYSSSRESASPL